MSSSKVFKDDPSFTPITLISEEIIPGDTAVVRQVPEPGTDEEEAVILEDNPEDVPENAGPSPPPPGSPPEAEPEPVDVERIRKESYQKGQEDAREELQARFESSLEALEEICRQLNDLHRNLLNGSRGEVINVVIALTRKILGRELSTSRDIIASTLEAALEAAIASDEYTITLHPDDLALAEEMHAGLIASIRGLNHISFKTDTSITRGGCLVESNLCSVDATIEGQLDTAREFLTQHDSDEDRAAIQDPDGSSS
ncbi:FliH/SctL family protein [Desulfolithobacter sp.]